MLIVGALFVTALVAGYADLFTHGWVQAGGWIAALCIGYLATVVGLAWIALFALTWFARIAWRSGAGMLRILPVLLVALVFTFLSAETWQSIGRLQGTPLVLAVVLVVALAFAPLLHGGKDEHAAAFADAAEVARALPVVLRPAGSLRYSSPPLALAERLNLRLIAVLGKALVAVTVALVVAAFFVVFGVLTVNRAVTATWVGTQPDIWWQASVGAHTYALTAEHVRVAMFLGAFSALYFIVSASTDRELARALSADAEDHVRSCLAVRALYRGTTGSADATAGRSVRRAGRRRAG